MLWVVWFLFYKVEEMDIFFKIIEIDWCGMEGFICCDNICVDIKVVFFVCVNKYFEDVICVVQVIGCKCVFDFNIFEQLFSVKFLEVFKMVGKQFDFVDFYIKCEEFCDQIIGVIGCDLNGYFFEDVVIDYFEQMLMEVFDSYNIFDVQGICKIIELMVMEYVCMNEFQNFEKKQIKKQDVEVQEVIFEFECQQVDVEVKQECEIVMVCVCEEVEIVKVQLEECFKVENVCICSDEEIQINEENCFCQVEVVVKNKECVIVVEIEWVEKDCFVEVIVCECEIELQCIVKEKEVEVEKKVIVDVICECVVVDCMVVEEEECIKELCIVEEVNCVKKVMIIMVEVEVQEGLVKGIKVVEVEEEVVKFDVCCCLIFVDVEFEVVDKEVQVKICFVEGVQVEVVVEGFVEVCVKEQDVFVVEKQGCVEVVVLCEQGFVEVFVIQEKFVVEVVGIEKKVVVMVVFDEVMCEYEEF